ncbi:hypothetical protein EO804_14635 [Salmonella enterica]|nr:hypothetical protein [Salmonella enterica]
MPRAPDWRWRFNDFCLTALRLSSLRHRAGCRPDKMRKRRHPPTNRFQIIDVVLASPLSE